MSNSRNDESQAHSFVRRGAPGLVGLAVALGLFAATAVQGQGKDGDDDGKRLAARAEIEALERCYARGTDAIGRGDAAAGHDIYADCFTPDATIEVFVAGSDPAGPPDLAAIGPDAWADVVDASFLAAGFVGTQHMITNVEIDLDGNTAAVASYLSATHFIDPAGSAFIAKGTYFSDVVRTPQGWRISRRTLQLLGGVQIESL